MSAEPNTFRPSADSPHLKSRTEIKKSADTMFKNSFGGLDVPVTFVWGREADITPLADGRDLADDADARLVVIDDAKLLPHVEHPGAFLEIAREALTAPASAEP